MMYITNNRETMNPKQGQCHIHFARSTTFTVCTWKLQHQISVAQILFLHKWHKFSFGGWIQVVVYQRMSWLAHNYQVISKVSAVVILGCDMGVSPIRGPTELLTLNRMWNFKKFYKDLNWNQSDFELSSNFFWQFCYFKKVHIFSWNPWQIFQMFHFGY